MTMTTAELNAVIEGRNSTIRAKNRRITSLLNETETNAGIAAGHASIIKTLEARIEMDKAEIARLMQNQSADLKDVARLRKRVQEREFLLIPKDATIAQNEFANSDKNARWRKRVQQVKSSSSSKDVILTGSRGCSRRLQRPLVRSYRQISVILLLSKSWRQHTCSFAHYNARPSGA